MLDAYSIPIATTAGRVKVTKFTANGTYQQSTQLLYAWVRLVGGGGGGASAGNLGTGGGGGYSEKWLLASDIGNPVTVTVGAGGGADSAGGASSFAARSGTITGNGGNGGGVSSGAGGTASGGDLNLSGGDGLNNALGGSSFLGIASNLYGTGGIVNTGGTAGIVIVYEFLGS